MVQWFIMIFVVTFFMMTPAMDENPPSDDEGIEKNIFDLIEKGDVHTAEVMIQKHPEYLAQEKKGYYPLHEAVKKGLSSLVKTFIEMDDDVNRRSYWGERPLKYAALRGDLELIITLVNHGADPYAKDQWGGLPIAYAIINGHKHVVDYFLSQSFNPEKFFEDQEHWENGRELRTNNLLTLASCNGHLKIAQSLLKAGAPVTINDPYDIRPLYVAAKKGYLAIAELLLRHGADVNDHSKVKGFSNEDMDEPTPLVASIWSGNADMVRLFLAHGADQKYIYCGKNAQGYAQARLKDESVMCKAYEHILDLLNGHKFRLSTVENGLSDSFEIESIKCTDD